MKLLVYLHLYYSEQTDFFIEKLANIQGCDWELLVTFCEENEDVKNKILKFKPNTKFVKVDNIGYDSYPFLKILRMINLSDYDYIMKLHTKNKHTTCLELYNFIGKLYDYDWRDELIKPLIWDKHNFQKCLKLMQKNNTGLIGSKLLTLKATSKLPEDNELLDDLKKKLNITNPNLEFIAGTMFIIKSSALARLRDSNIDEKDFENVNAITKGVGTIAHAIERIFITLALEENLKVYKVQNYSLYFKFIFTKIAKSIFSLGNSYDKSHKIITILGIKIKFKRKSS